VSESFFFATFPERFTSRPRQTTKPFRKDLKNAANNNDNNNCTARTALGERNEEESGRHILLVIMDVNETRETRENFSVSRIVFLAVENLRLLARNFYDLLTTVDT